MSDDPVDRVAGLDAEIDDRAGPRRQDVFLDSPLDHGRRRGGAHQGVRRWPVCELPDDHPSQQPAVCDRQLGQERHLGSEPVEEEGRRTIERRRHGVALQAVHCRGHDSDGRLRGRHRGMSARGLGRKLDADRSFLGDADQGHRLFHAGDDSLGDRQAFVEGIFKADFSRCENFRNPRGPGLAADFLVMAEGQIDRLSRLEALFQKHLDGLEDRHHAALVIEGSSAPDEAVGNVARERSVGPALTRFPARPEQHPSGPSASTPLAERFAPLPREQQAVAADQLAGELLVDLRKARFQEFVKAIEVAEVGIGCLCHRHGRNPDGCAEPLQRAVVDIKW